MPDTTTSPPVLTLLQTGGPAPIVADGDNWILDLGQVQAGTLLRTLHFGVLNDAAAGADALSVGIDVAADPDYRVAAPASFDGITPGSGRGEVAVILQTADPGLHLATITLHPSDIAADGTVTPLPDRVLTIREEVVGTLDAATIPGDAFAATLPASRLLTTPVLLDGQAFARIQNVGSWTGSGTLDFAPDRAAAAQYGDAYALATFQTVHADFSGAGAGRTIDVIGVESGTLALARGDAALWSFAGGGTAQGATITTAGHADVTVTAIGVDPLDDRLAANSLLPYAIYPGSVPRGPSTYDGHLSTATVVLGGHRRSDQ